jgi:hypothetical protein
MQIRLTVLLLFLCTGLACTYPSGQRPSGVVPKPKQTGTPRPASLLIYEDEARLKGKMAIIGGRAKNLSKGRLSELKIQLELTRRGEGEKERMEALLSPSTLLPGEQGEYQITVPSSDYSGARILEIRSGRTSLAFKTTEGRKRPREAPPVDNSPRAPGGDEFINTPDSATRL